MPNAVYLLIGFVAGAVVFFTIGWLVALRRTPAALPADNRLEATLLDQLKQKGLEQQNLQDQLLALNQANGALNAQVKLMTERLAAEQSQLIKIEEKLHKDFQNISTKLLAENTTSFNRQSAENFDNLLKPLKEKISDFKSSLDKTYDATTVNSALLKEQVSRISTEAANLAKALKGDIKILGNWGENMLDAILEKSGLQMGLNYRRQHGTRDEAGDQRFLDVIVNLPDGKNLIIDSKVSLGRYEQYVNSSDDAERLNHLAGHIESVRTHFKSLGAKRYQDIHSISSPDFVLMYVPIEAAFFVAVAHQPNLFAEALEKNVVLITNSTLLATLRTVGSIWRLADQQRNADEIAKRGGLLYDKFVGFISDLNQIGDSIDTSQKAWKSASNKLHSGTGNLVWQTEQLKTLKVKATKTLPEDVIDKAIEGNSGNTLPPA